MTYPTDDLTNTHLDASTDDPSQARSEINAAVLKIQAMIAATGTGANNALKLDSNGDIPSGVDTADPVDLTTDVTGLLPTANIAALAITAAKIAASAVTRSKISTSTVSLAGSITSATSVDITLTAYSFFPMIHQTDATSTVFAGGAVYVVSGTMKGHSVDGADPDSPRFSLFNGKSKTTATYDVDYRYIQA